LISDNILLIMCLAQNEDTFNWFSFNKLIQMKTKLIIFLCQTRCHKIPGSTYSKSQLTSNGT
jgi:hypothetical protein